MGGGSSVGIVIRGEESFWGNISGVNLTLEEEFPNLIRNSHKLNK